MTESDKTISSLISSQLPDFVRADHPIFKRFLELYYQWMEQNSPEGISNTAGNTIYHAMQIENYRDIDQTPPEFVRYFKDEILPYFPENTSLSTEKIIKAAREFYSKKGSDESLRWLFKALFDEDIEINYPKEQIFKTSDGKWNRPKAFRITVNEENKNINVNLLERRLVTGVDSGATCIVESANRSVDPTNGKEVFEIYVSNLKKFFNNGEYIEIVYFDENNTQRIFRERIIGTLSNIRVDSNIRTDPQQRRRGLLYNVGDPIVIVGGLGDSAQANDAAAIVGNVTLGSIEGVTQTFRGYGYRVYSNSEVVVFRSVGDDENANLSTDLRVVNVNLTACTTNSQRNFLETITFDKTVIDYVSGEDIGNANFGAFTSNNRNIVLNVTEDDAGDPFLNYAVVWANGNNYSDALFTAKIATPNGNTKLQGTLSYYGNTQLTGTVSVYGKTPITGNVTVNTHTTDARTVYGNGTSFLVDFVAGNFIRIDDYILEIASVDSNTIMKLTDEISQTRTQQPAFKANLTVTGSGTSFLSELSPGDRISVNNVVKVVNTVVSNTVLTVTTPFEFSGNSFNFFQNAQSTSVDVFGENTAFAIELKPNQLLEIDGERRTVNTISNNYHLTVTAGYSSVLADEDGYRIGRFAADGGFGTEYTGTMVLYSIANTGSLSAILNGAQLNVMNTTVVESGKFYTNQKSFTVNSPIPVTYLLPTNANSILDQAFDFHTENTGGIELISVINGGSGFRSSPRINVSSYYDTHLSEQYDYDTEYELKANTRQLFRDLGAISHVYILNGGSQYQVNDTISFRGRGYGGNGYVQSVNANGAITSVVLTDRGEGYLRRPEVIVNRTSPTFTTLTGTAEINQFSPVVTGTSTSFVSALRINSVIKVNNEIRKVVSIANNTHLTVNAIFQASANAVPIYRQNGIEAVMTGYLFGDGEELTIQTSAVGRVRDIRLLYRGYDYFDVPEVSLKVYDAIIDPIPADSIIETEAVYQGTSAADATFKANIKSYTSGTNLLRMYNYSGLINPGQTLITANGLILSINASANVPAPAQYPSTVIATGLPNPMRYGNGRARARALFANGLIEFNGFYLNTDGFPSSDKVLQDTDLYHNFSYIVQSEKNLVEFEVPIRNIVHPAGMSLISKTVLKNELRELTGNESNVDIIMRGAAEFPSVATIANSYSNVIIGYQTIWNPLPNDNFYYSNTKVNVGDLFIINDAIYSGNVSIQDRIPISKIVTDVISNTELKIEGDFIYRGPGLIDLTANYSPIITALSNGTASVLQDSNVVSGTVTKFQLDLALGDFIKINDEVRQVASIASNTSLITDLPFNETAATQTLNLLGTVIINPAVTGTAAINSPITGNVLVNPPMTGTVNVDVSGIQLTFNVTNGSATIVSGSKNVNGTFGNLSNGTVSVTGGSNVVTGTSTTFQLDLAAGYIIKVNNEIRQVESITSNVSLVSNSNFTNSALNKIISLGSTRFVNDLEPGDYIRVNNEVRRIESIFDQNSLNVDNAFVTSANVDLYLKDGYITYPTYLFLTGNNTLFATNIAVNDIIAVNNQIRQVVNVINDTLLQVNSRFFYGGTDETFYLRSNIITGNATTFTTNLNANDIITVNGEIKQVVSITNNTSLVVNTAFDNYAIGQLLYVKSNVIVGTGTNFDPQINIGDIITVNNEIKEVVTVTSDTLLVVNTPFEYYATNQKVYKHNNKIYSATTNLASHLVPNNFIMVNNQTRQVMSIDSSNVITVNAVFDYHGSANIISKLQPTILNISSNVDPVSSYVLPGDNISFNIFASNLMIAQTGTVQVFNTNSKVIGTSTSFNTQFVANDTIMINGSIKRVENIANATVMNVNSAFSNNSTGKLIYKRASYQNANVISINGGVITTNLEISTNASNLVYLVDPNFRRIDFIGSADLSGNTVTANTANGSTISDFDGYVYIGNEIIANGEYKTVVDVTTNQLTVNSNFINPAVDKYLAVYTNHSYNVVTLTAH